MSAALSTTGWLDSQEVLIASRFKDRSDDDYPSRYEYERAELLCKWGAPYGVEGFVRMNTGFEIMWCDFHSPSIQLVSHLNITPPGTPAVDPNEPPPRLPGGPRPPGGGSRPGPSRPPWRRETPSPLARDAYAEWIRAAAHRSLTPQAHVKLDYSSIVSFYNPRLRSLMDAREGQRMRTHRVWPNISKADADSVADELEDVLQRRGHGSGMDWVALARGIVEEWGGRVVQMREFLWNATNALDEKTPVNMTETLAAVRRLAYSPLNPYMDTSAASNASAWDVFFDPHHSPLLHTPHFANTSALHRCMFSATGVLIHNNHIHTTPQEVLLQGSIETVLARLCTDFGAIFAESMDVADVPEDEDMVTFLQQWEVRMQTLMEWLDWTEWLRCDEICPWDSVCVMNMWPRGMPHRGPGDSPSDEDPSEWVAGSIQIKVYGCGPNLANCTPVIIVLSMSSGSPRFQVVELESI
ncbi:hypothetical protein B0H21DRAFT_705704 [Amylocystis lapponica]|nr:hypothetical protein B0H21DRAFT_705704 [Amylocystis lapponica]